MNLSHFLNKPFEEDVIKKLEDVHADSVKYYLTLWYEDDTLKPTKLKDFIKRYESRLFFKTIIKVGNGNSDGIISTLGDNSLKHQSDALRWMMEIGSAHKLKSLISLKCPSHLIQEAVERQRPVTGTWEISA